MRRLLWLALLLSASRGEADNFIDGVNTSLGTLKAANLNSTADQAIPIHVGATGGRYLVKDFLVDNCTSQATTAAGGLYTAASKGGTAIVAAVQTYAAADNAGGVQVATLAVTNKVWTAATLFFSLTTPKGSAITCDLHVIGYRLVTDGGIVTPSAPVQFTVIQRAAGVGDIPVAGTLRCEGGVATVEARFDGGSWTAVDTEVSCLGGGFAGSLAAQPEGHGSLDFRAVQAAVTGSSIGVPDVGVGDVYMLMGQSNASGRAFNTQAFTGDGALFGNDYLWHALTDPTDTAVGQVDSVSNDGGSASGSVWPLVMTALASSYGVPVAVVPCAFGATSIIDWLPGADHFDRSTLYGSCAHRASLTGCRAALWWQGEWDAGGQGFDTPEATYNARLDTLANAWVVDAGCELMPAKFQDCTGLAQPPQDAINAAIGTAWSDNVNVLTGPGLTGLTSDDEFHIRTNVNIAAAATLWVSAIEAALP